MKFPQVRRFAVSLPEVTEEPHHHFGSFRVRGKIFVTVPPDMQHIHVFVSEQEREQALAMYPSFTEKLFWGGKVVGVRVALAAADPHAVKALVRSAWQHKASKALRQPNGQSQANAVAREPEPRVSSSVRQPAARPFTRR